MNSLDTVYVNGNAAASNADSLVYDVMAAFYTACTSFISQNFGAGKRENILKCYFVSLLYSFLMGAALGVGLFFGGKIFLRVFTSDAAVVEAGYEKLKIMSFSFCISAFMDGSIAACRGMGKTFIPTVIVILGSCVFRVIWVYTVFAHFHTMTGLYALYPVSWVLTALAENIYFAVIYKKSKRFFTAAPTATHEQDLENSQA